MIRPWRDAADLLLALAAITLLGCDGALPPSPGSLPPVTEPAPPPRSTGLPPLWVSGGQFYAGSQPFIWAGVTAFDLPRRFAEGEHAYLDWAAETGFTLIRVVPASLFRTPRTLDQGVAELGPLLDAAADRGLYVEVVVGVDTVLYGLTQDQFLDYAARIADVTNARSNVVIEMANELRHTTQRPYLESPSFQRQVLQLFTAPASAGSTHGGQTLKWDAGDYMTHHANRAWSPEDNAAMMARAERRFGKGVVDDEGLGIKGTPQGNRTNDPGYGERQAIAARAHGLAGVTLHLDMGLEARLVDDPIQQEAARRFVAAMRGH